MKLFPLVSIFILNWNRKQETIRAIESALNQTYSNKEIVVVDNGSNDGSTELIPELYPSVKFIKLDKNYGCPGGRNRGISYCNGEFIFFCDNDGVLHEKAIEIAVELIKNENNVAVITGLVKEFKDESEIDTRLKITTTPIKKETNSFQGGISMHRKIIYTEIGNYPEDYMYGSEEDYLSYRILDANYKIIKSEQVILWHKKSSTARNTEKEIFHAWNNRLINAYQLYPIEYFIIYILYYSVAYPYYALKKGIFIHFFKFSFKNIKRFKRYKRKPIKRNTFKKFNHK